MTEDELDEIFAEVEGYFPMVCAHLRRAPKLLTLWRRTLQPFSAPLVLEAIARAASKNSHTLELDDLLACLHHLLAEHQQTIARRAHRSPKQDIAATLRPWLEQAARRARTPEDRLIAKLHCETVYRGLNRPTPEIQRQAAVQWRQWATAYPAIREHCLQQAEACCQLVEEQRETVKV